jgi:hypothetical protein
MFALKEEELIVDINDFFILDFAGRVKKGDGT